MPKELRATLYTPVFPPSLPISKPFSSASASCDSNTTSNAPRTKSYIDRIKERHILLASLPSDDLCPPSREASPEAEGRVEALRMRMRNGHHIPELTLACCGIRGGDWVGEPASDEEREYVLPNTEAEWFEWERKKTSTRERRRAQKKELERREKITKWSEGVEEVESSHLSDAAGPVAPCLRFPVVKRGGGSRVKGKGTATRDFTRQSPSCHNSGQQREDSEPVDRASSPMPSAPTLHPVPDFFDSFLTLPDTPPSLHQLEHNLPIPIDVPPTPSFAVKHTHTSTPLKRDCLDGSALQLSSPISPPRTLHSLMAFDTLPSLQRKRSRETGEDGSAADTTKEPITPRIVKKAHTVQPITPISVVRPNGSQDPPHCQDPSRLPTLTDLLAASSRKASPRSKLKGTPSRGTPVIASFSPSQPTYAMFRPQFQSTQQPRAWSLPPPSSQPMRSTRPISPQKSIAGMGSSSGIEFYQSQFNVEGKIDEVTAFLNADVWEVET